MSVLDERVTVWRLAILTEGLDRTERTALRNEAERLEREWNKLTSMNLERRLRARGPLDLFAEWDEPRRGKHAEWWDRFTGQWKAFLTGGARALGPQPPKPAKAKPKAPATKPRSKSR